MKLKCTSGPMKGEEIELSELKSLVLGREPKDEVSEIKKLASNSVSRNHCRIEFEQGMYKITDLKSSNGIRLNRQKVIEAFLKAGDVLQIGEFSFLVEPDQISLPEPAAAIKLPPQKSAQNFLKKLDLKNKYKSSRESFDRLDFYKKLGLFLFIALVLGHFVSSIAIIQESKRALLKESYGIARQVVQGLGEKSRVALQQKSPVLLDCNSVRKISGVREAYLFDEKGVLLCPAGARELNDGLTEATKNDLDDYNDCRYRIDELGLGACSFMSPVRNWSAEKNQFEIVGFARIEYALDSVFTAVDDLESVQWKTLFLALALILVVWIFAQKWMKSGVKSLADAVHVVAGGNATNVERIESFAALDPLVDELNKLLINRNQGLKAESGRSQEEASFLQSLFQQVLLLEERAVLVVDKENQILAATAVLADIIPIDLSRTKAHITDIVQDTHLQGELMGFLNDLSQSEQPIERALTMSDRVVQVRGLPIVVSGNMLAAVLVF